MKFEIIKKENPVLFKIIENSLKNSKVSHSYLLTSDKYQNIDNEALFIIGSIISGDVNNPVDPRKYSDYHFIDGSYGLKKDDVVNAIQELSRSALDDRGYKFLHIKNIENAFGDSATNSILKFIEEPPQNTYIIMSSNNSQKVLSTIKSRSQRIKIYPTDIKVLNMDIKKQGISSLDSLVIAHLVCSIDELNSFDLGLYKTLSKKVSSAFKKALENKKYLSLTLKKIVTKSNYLLLFRLMTIYINDIWRAKENIEIAFKASEETLKKYALTNFDITNALIAINTFFKRVEQNVNFQLALSSLFVEIGKSYE